MIAVPKRLKGVHRDRTFAGFLLCVMGAGLDALIAIILLLFSFYFIRPPLYVHYRRSNTVHTKKEKNKSPSSNYLGLIAINILGYILSIFSPY